MNPVKTKVMVSKIGQVTVKPSSKKDPCGSCGRKTIANSVLCKLCQNWIHGRCAKIKRVTMDFENVEDQENKLHDNVETVTDFSYLGGRISSGGGCEAAVTSTTRLGLVGFSDC